VARTPVPPEVTRRGRARPARGARSRRCHGSRSGLRPVSIRKPGIALERDRDIGERPEDRLGQRARNRAAEGAGAARFCAAVKMKSEDPLWAVKALSGSRLYVGYGADSAPSGGDPWRGTIRPKRSTLQRRGDWVVTLVLRPRVMTRRGHIPRRSCALRVPPLAGLCLDSDENGAPERVELSRAGALGASQFGFHSPHRVLRPEPRDEFLDVAPKGAHEDGLFLWRGREVAVAIDLGHRVASAFGRDEVIGPEAQKSTLGWLWAPGSGSRMRASTPMARYCATKLEQLLAVESFSNASNRWAAR
jgi:hypothetical protein